MQEEHVLVIPADRLEQLGGFNGFRTYSAEAMEVLLDEASMEFRPRDSVEEDPSYKQLIPYAILECDVDGDKQVFQYTRGKGQGERRLHAKRSIGIGGHISREDADSSDLYRTGLLRELNEEVQIDCGYQERIVGFIYDDASPVGRVHLGVVHLLHLDGPQVTAREADLLDAGFEPLNSLLKATASFETWSQLCLSHAF